MKNLLWITAAALLGLQDAENPEYQRWASFKPGSWAKYKSEIETNGNKMVLPIEMVSTLMEIDEKKVLVEELTVNTMLPKDSPKQEKARKRTYQAKTKKKEAADKEGDEEIDVGGKKLACHWTEVKPAGGGFLKVWINPDVPGGIVRMETAPPGLNGVQRLNLLAWEKK